ncbi:MAG: hypothetical protein R6V60_05440 [Desulfobacterales bacterium]
MEKHRTGASAAGYETSQLKVFFRQHVAKPVFVPADGDVAAPLIAVQVKLFESGLVTPQEVLGITDKDRGVGCNGEYHGGAAWAGKEGQSAAQPIEGIADTPADKGVDRHGMPANQKVKLTLLKPIKKIHNTIAVTAQLQPPF